MGRMVILVALVALSVGQTAASDCAMIRACKMKMGALSKIRPDNTCTPQGRAEIMDLYACMKETVKDSLDTENCPGIAEPLKYRSYFRKMYDSAFFIVCTGCPVVTPFWSCYSQNLPGDQCNQTTAESILDQKAACVVRRVENEPLCEDQMERLIKVNAAYKELTLAQLTDNCAGKGEGGKKRSAPAN